MKIAGVYKTYFDIERPEVILGIDEPLGLEYILAVAQQQGHKVDLFVPKHVNDIEEIIAFNPDIILHSCTTNQINSVITLNKNLKIRKPDLLSIIGGYHASVIPEIIKQGFDFAVIGEGERTFSELLISIEEERNYSEINGLAFLQENQLIITPKRERIENLDNLPDPFRTEKILKHKSKYLGYPPTNERETAYMEYSRGCLFDCKFCASLSMLGQKIMYRKPETVLRQLKYLKENFGTNNIFFTDLNMTLQPEKVEELANALIEANLNIYWHVMSGFTKIDQNLLAKMKQSGCNKISWGLENIYNPNWITNETTKLPSLTKMQEILDYSAELGIMNLGFIIIGWPEETKEQLEETKKILPSYNLHMLRPSIYTPFPKTTDYELMKQQDLLTETNWSKYDTTHLVFKHPNLTNQELRKIQKDILKYFYQSPEYKKRVKEFTTKFKEYKESFDEFLQTHNF